jgi:hypothetical protein
LPPKPQPQQHVAPAMPTFDRLVQQLSQITVDAASLSFDDQVRFRNVLLGVTDLMMAKTRVSNPDDRAAFEASLREAAAKRHGG